MSKKEKLLAKLFSRPTDFTWNELCSLMGKLGFQELQGRGSRVQFYHPEHDHPIFLHRPHPGNIIKRYVIDYVLNELKGLGIKP